MDQLFDDNRGPDQRSRCLDLLLAERKASRATTPELRQVLHELLRDRVFPDSNEKSNIEEVIRAERAKGRDYEALVLANIEVEKLHMRDRRRSTLLAEQACEIAVGQLGESHMECAQARNNLGVLLVEANDLANGREMIADSLKIRRECVGGRHRDYAEGLITWGFIQEKYGMQDVALDVYLESLDIFLETGELDDPDLKTCLVNLLSLVATKGDPSRMLDLNDVAPIGPDAFDTAEMPPPQDGHRAAPTPIGVAGTSEDGAEHAEQSSLPDGDDFESPLTLHLARAREHFGYGYLDAAIRSFERALDADSKSAEVARGLRDALVERSRRTSAAGDTSEALRDLRRAALICPDDAKIKTMISELEKR